MIFGTLQSTASFNTVFLTLSISALSHSRDLTTGYASINTTLTNINERTAGANFWPVLTRLSRKNSGGTRKVELQVPDGK